MGTCGPAVSILIVTFNNETIITACLESIRRQTFCDYEVLVQDNASRDATANIVQQYSFARLFRSPVNSGFAAAMNALAKQARGVFLLLLNPDCILPADGLERMLEFAGNGHDVVAPALVFPNGMIQPSARSWPTFSRMIFGRKSPLYLMGISDLKRAGYVWSDTPVKVPAVSATALLVRKQTFEKVGYFDERFRLYFEDLDLCIRLAKEGIEIWYFPLVKVTHFVGASSNKGWLWPLWHHYLSGVKYFAKHSPKRRVIEVFLLPAALGGFVISVLLRILGLTRKR